MKGFLDYNIKILFLGVAAAELNFREVSLFLFSVDLGVRKMGEALTLKREAKKKKLFRCTCWIDYGIVLARSESNEPHAKILLIFSARE
jgi:hypothetical protein